MASYQQQNDYQSYGFTPFQPPTQQIIQGIQAKTNFWIEGAEKAKDAYQQAVGLELSHASSKQKLQDFMVQADQQMQKASRSDLSVSDNVKSAVGIFKPLYQDKALMIDNQLTEYYKHQNQEAEKAKVVNGGKEYSQINHQYMLDKYQDFLGDNNEDNWGKHFAEKRGYTPYYDYNSEFNETLKNCHPDSDDNQSADSSLYFTNTKSKTLSSEKLAGCLQNISGKAQNQMRIEGYMAYGKNYQAVGMDYLNHTQQELATYGEKASAIQGQLQGLRDKKNQTDADKNQAQILQQQLDATNNYIQDQSKTRGAIAKGDLSYIKDNYEDLSGTLYKKQLMNNFSTYHAYHENSIKKEENNAAMLIYKTQAEATMMGEKFRQQKELQQDKYSFEYKLKMSTGLKQQANNDGTHTKTVQNPDGTISVVPDYAPLAPTENQTIAQQSQKDVEDRMAAANEQKSAADNYIYGQLKSTFPQYKDAASMIGSTEFANYMKANPESKDIKRWLNVATPAAQLSKRYQAIQVAVDKELQTTSPELFGVPDLSGITPYVLPNHENTRINGATVFNAINGRDPNLKISYNYNDPNNGGNVALGVMPGAYSNTGITIKATYKGQDISNIPAVQQTVSEVLRRNKDNSDKLSEKRANLYEKQRLRIDGMRSIGEDNTEKNVFKSRVAAQLQISPEDAKKDLFLQASDLKGAVYVKVDEDKVKDAPERLKALGAIKQKDGSYKFENVPEYTFFNGNAHYAEVLQNIDAEATISEGKINRGEPLEIQIPTEQDVKSGSPYPSYKLIIKKGILPGQKFYEVAEKQENNTYVPLPMNVNSPEEALEKIKIKNARQQ